MTPSLKDEIEGRQKEDPDSALDKVWVSCVGENPVDVEQLGPIAYYPQQGFPGYYFPFNNTEGYLSPLVAIEFQRPQRKWY